MAAVCDLIVCVPTSLVLSSWRGASESNQWHVTVGTSSQDDVVLHTIMLVCFEAVKNLDG